MTPPKLHCVIGTVRKACDTRLEWNPGWTVERSFLPLSNQPAGMGMDALGRTTPPGRMGDPAETGAVAAFLASSDSSFMTGGGVFVDGGLAQV